MKVVGFSFIRNAIRYDYPIVEAIRSILPLCEEVVVAVGASDDATQELVQSISPKVRIVPTIWDDSLREGGRVLAIETDKAYRAVPEDADWAFYIQGDEVIHEKYHPAIRAGMEKYQHQPEVEGLLFNYLHFYGSYDYVGDSTRWYRREVRIVRKDPAIYSYRDAQGFRKGDNKKLQVKALEAWVYHYGWVKDPRAMQQKQETFNRYWHDDQWIDTHIAKAEAFDYSQVDALRHFEGSHPAVMQERVKEKNWQFDYDIAKNRYSKKEQFKRWIERWTGHRIGEYKNFRLI